MYPNETQTDQRKYVEMVIGNLTSVLKEIHTMGGRKIAFQNAGPLGCLPSMQDMNPNLGGECAEEPSKLARLHIRYLASVLKKLESELLGYKYSLFDYYKSLGDRVSNPSTYGFKEGKAVCCGSGTYRGSGCGGGMNGTELFEVCSDLGAYVWFDDGHTTERTNSQLAELLWNGVPIVTAPYNIKQLFELA